MMTDFAQGAARNVTLAAAVLLRASRSGAPSIRHPQRLPEAIGLLIVISAAIGIGRAGFDAWTFGQTHRLPDSVAAIFFKITDFDKSGLLIFPLFVLLLLCIAAMSCGLPRFSQLVMASITVRIGFLFLAIEVPALITLIAKYVIGSVRRFVTAGDPHLFVPFLCRSQYASLPSGHPTTAFAAAVAFGSLWPRARPVVWTYAFVIAASRLIVTAHFPSDIVASAAVGVLGSLSGSSLFCCPRTCFFYSNGRNRVPFRWTVFPAYKTSFCRLVVCTFRFVG